MGGMKSTTTHHNRPMCRIIQLGNLRILTVAVWLFLFCTTAVGLQISAVAQQVPTGAALQEDWFYRSCLKAQFPEIQRSIGDHRRAFDPASGRNFVYQDGTWIDAKTGQNVCPKKPPPGAALQEDWLYRNCLLAQFPEIQRNIGDHTRAYDPPSGRNFAYEDGTWIDVKTGEAICPKTPPPQPKTTQHPQPGSQVGSVPALKLDPWEKRILDVHNAERARFGYNPLKWNPALEATATAYANQLARTGQLAHASRQGRGTERENVNQGMLGWNTDQMMRNWLSERANFVPGTFPNVSRTGNWSDVGHYSQMIWPTTTDIGCGLVTGSGFQWIVCRYNPGGNKDGKPVGQVQTQQIAADQPILEHVEWYEGHSFLAPAGGFELAPDNFGSVVAPPSVREAIAGENSGADTAVEQPVLPTNEVFNPDPSQQPKDPPM